MYFGMLFFCKKYFYVIRLNSCPSCNSSLECSGNGICIEGVCACNESYTGEACDIPTCPNNCSYNGICRKEEHRCECYSKYRGKLCFWLLSYCYLCNSCLSRIISIQA